MFIPFSFGIVKKKKTESDTDSELVLCSKCKNEIKKQAKQASPQTQLLPEAECDLPPPVAGSDLSVVAVAPSSAEKARQDFLKNGPTVTEHCLLQNFARVYKVPIEEFRQELLQKIYNPIMNAKVFKGRVTVDGITYVIVNGAVVTCHEKKKNKPKLKGKALKKAKERHQR
jgi:hypothetical protein